MRTTVDLSDDILQAAKELAKIRHQTLGAVVSDLVRKGLSYGVDVKEDSPSRLYQNDVPLLPRRPGEVITREKVEDLDRESLS